MIYFFSLFPLSKKKNQQWTKMKAKVKNSQFVTGISITGPRSS